MNGIYGGLGPPRTPPRCGQRRTMYLGYKPNKETFHETATSSQFQ